MEYRIHTASQLAGALQSRRKQKGMTQVEAGRSIGLLPKTISGLETDPERASLRSFLLMLSALDLELVLRPKDEPISDAAVDW